MKPSLPLLLFLTSLLLLTGCSKKNLFTNLKEEEANEVIAALDQKGIPADKEPGAENAFIVSIAADQFAEAVSTLEARGLPRQRYALMGEVFKKTGLVSSPTEERIRFMFALSEEIASTLTRIDGVIVARVHPVLPQNEPFAEKIQPSSAAVFIKYRPDSDIESAIPQIKNLVVNSIEGLSYDRVTVALFPAEPSVPEITPPQRVLSLEIAPGSIDRFWLILTSLGALLLAALCAIGYLLFLQIQTQKKLEKTAK